MGYVKVDILVINLSDGLPGYDQLVADGQNEDDDENKTEDIGSLSMSTPQVQFTLYSMNIFIYNGVGMVLNLDSESSVPQLEVNFAGMTQVGEQVNCELAINEQSRFQGMFLVSNFETQFQ